MSLSRSSDAERFQRPTATEEYPDGPANLEERFRGAHVLRRDENGPEKCVACFLCAAACPANCIYIEAAENTAQQRISGGERYASSAGINRRVVGDERALQERRKRIHLGPESCG